MSHSSNHDYLLHNTTEVAIDSHSASHCGRGRGNRHRGRRGDRGNSSCGHGRGTDRGRGRGRGTDRGRGRGRGTDRGRGRGRGTDRGRGHCKTPILQASSPQSRVVSLFWNVSPLSEIPSISVYVSSTAISDPCVLPDSYILFNHNKFPDVLSHDLTLVDGFYFIYFYRNGVFTLNPAYPVHDTYHHNFFTVGPSVQRKQLDFLTNLSTDEALLFQLEYYFSDDYFFEGTPIHLESRKTKKKPARWVSFDYFFHIKMFNQLASEHNVELTAEYLHQLSQNSDGIESDLRYGIRRKKALVPTEESVNTRKVFVFPLLSSDEVIDVVTQIHSLDITTSSFVAFFSEGCKAIRASVTVQDANDAVMLVQGNSINVNGRDLIVRYQHQINHNFDSETSSVVSNEDRNPKIYHNNANRKQDRRKSKTKSVKQRWRHREETGLPILHAYNDIVNRMENEKVLVCIAETGSGKTTQLPQFSAEYCFKKFGKGNFKVVCTQPRAIAAFSLADFIAMEYDGTQPGNNVGYKVGQKNVNGEEIILTTDGSLIRKAAKDLLLSDVKVLIIDEAHERSLDTDIVLGIAKLILQQRDDFRVIIASATIDPTPFLQFF
ncbi:hypothetical protein P9112_008315 [Eukaryota sp. TZLM1-RC]